MTSSPKLSSLTSVTPLIRAPGLGEHKLQTCLGVISSPLSLVKDHCRIQHLFIASFVNNPVQLQFWFLSVQSLHQSSARLKALFHSPLGSKQSLGQQILQGCHLGAPATRIHSSIFFQNPVCLRIATWMASVLRVVVKELW